MKVEVIYTDDNKDRFIIKEDELKDVEIIENYQ